MKMIKKIRLHMVARGLVAMVGTALIVFTSTPAFAQITVDDVASIREGTAWWDPTETDVCEATGGSLNLTISGTSPFLTGDPFALHYPNVTDEAKFAQAMTDFLRKASPNSPWLSIDGFGQKMVDEGKSRDINPMLIMVIGRKETQFGTTGSGQSHNNSFGNKSGEDYKNYPSFAASLFGADSFTADVQNRLSGKHPSYKNVKNMYEYLSVHVSGRIIYPGDSTTSYDPIMDQAINSDNVVGYFTNARDWIAEMTGLSIAGLPDKNSANPSTNPLCTASGAGAGSVNPEGYAWPMAPQKKISYATAPCKSSRGCHHDGTPAFDLFYGPTGTTDGKAVYAITDGKIVSRKQYGGVAGCYSIQFYSTKDKMYYWYGHLQNPKVATGDTVTAGKQIAEVGRNSLGPSCRGGRDHLHIDRGCIRGGVPQTGGGKSCRDPRFVPLMNAMWEQLES